MIRKTRVVLTAVYKNGDALKKDFAIPTRIDVLSIPGTDKLKEVSIRLAVDSSIAEELLEGLCSGVVSLDVEQMLSPVEREIKS